MNEPPVVTIIGKALPALLRLSAMAFHYFIATALSLIRPHSNQTVPLLDLQLLRCGQAFIQFCSAACNCVRQFQTQGFDVRFE